MQHFTTDGRRPFGNTTTVETHISRIFLTPDRVFKLLKPIRTDFLDFTDVERRCEAAQKEFDLNAAISPDVYLGLADLVENGVLADRMIIMRRLPADRQLDRFVGTADFPAAIEATARTVAAMHAGFEPIRDLRAAGASIASLRQNWQDNAAVLGNVVGPVISASDFREVNELWREYLDGRGELFDHRLDQGWVREGHGDLRAEHVFYLDDGPRLIDCLAFRDDYRVGDVLADISFLAMDLHRIAGLEAAIALLRAHHRFTNEVHPMTLAHHYVAYRAHVRAKIECIRFGQGDTSAAEHINAYHSLALQHLRQGRLYMVIVGGGAGTGKSTVAAGVAERIGAVWIRSDEIRKDIVGVGHNDHLFAEPGEGAYRDDVTHEVYAEMLRQAKVLLGQGVSVVLDATWASVDHREAARVVAGDTSAALTELRCGLDHAIARERIARRMSSLHNPSDATPEIADHIAAAFDPWAEAAIVDTADSITNTIAEACLVVLRRISEPWEGVPVPVHHSVSRVSVAQNPS